MYTLRFNTQEIWQPLKKGDRIAIVAPARQGKPGELELIRSFLNSWGLEAHIPKDLLGEDLLCANRDEKRFQYLNEALNSPDYAAVWCLRGGYGCTRLMPELIQLKASEHFKWFIGFSDITALHSWLNTHWHWPTLHGSGIRQLACHEVDELTLQSLKNILFGQVVILRFGLFDHDSHTLEEVGEIVGLTRERVRQIQIDALKKLRIMLESEGLDC